MCMRFPVIRWDMLDLYIMDLQEFLSERCDISECDIVRKQAIFEKIFKPNIR